MTRNRDGLLVLTARELQPRNPGGVRKTRPLAGGRGSKRRFAGLRRTRAASPPGEYG